MHVLVLPSWYATPDKPWRGTFIRNQARALAVAGVQTGVAFVERRPLSRFSPAALVSSHFQTVAEDDDGVVTLRIRGWSPFAQTVPGSLLWVRLMVRLASDYADRYGVPDVVHGHAVLWGGYAAMHVAEMFGRPGVITEHSSAILTGKLSSAERRRAASAYRRASAVVAVSRALARRVDAVAGRRVAEVIPNAVDTDLFTPCVTRREARPFTYLSIGDLVPSKRHDLLIESFARVHAAERETRLVIVGEGRCERSLLRAAARAGITEAVRFTGPMPPWRVRHWLREADALVVSSDFETFSMVAIEAMASGVPVVATRCGGPEEILRGEVGLIAERGDAGALASAMEGIRSRPLSAVRLRAEAVSRYALPVVAHRLLRVYERISGGDAGRFGRSSVVLDLVARRRAAV